MPFKAKEATAPTTAVLERLAVEAQTLQQNADVGPLGETFESEGVSFSFTSDPNFPGWDAIKGFSVENVNGEQAVTGGSRNKKAILYGADGTTSAVIWEQAQYYLAKRDENGEPVFKAVPWDKYEAARGRVKYLDCVVSQCKARGMKIPVEHNVDIEAAKALGLDIDDGQIADKMATLSHVKAFHPSLFARMLQTNKITSDQARAL